MAEFEQIIFEKSDEGIARIILNRPEARNAQDAHMLYEINDAMDLAANDDEIKVIVVSANGPHFSAGHDLREKDPIGVMKEFKSVSSWGNLDGEAISPMFGREQEIYFGFCERWRNIPKPTMVAVHGKAIAGGLMLIWPFDIVIASEDASFQDNTVAMGICGAEFFNHPYEFGVRKAKEMLFTSDAVSAQDAFRLGAVNHVVPREELERFTLELAGKIAQKRLFTLKLTKMAVNAAQDNAGRPATNQAAFAYHHLLHNSMVISDGMPLAKEFVQGGAPTKGGALEKSPKTDA